jgi:hypothetical protein
MSKKSERIKREKEHQLQKQQRAREKKMNEKLFDRNKHMSFKETNLIPSYRVPNRNPNIRVTSLMDNNILAPQTKQVPIRYDDDDMQERETKAQQQISQLKKQVAIAYNKGPYMLITEQTDLTTIGKKN